MDVEHIREPGVLYFKNTFNLHKVCPAPKPSSLDNILLQFYLEAREDDIIPYSQETKSRAKQALADFIEEEKRRTALELITKNVTLEADLAWCIGKLAGLGHPAEHLEEKYQHLWKQEEKQ